MGWLPPRTGSQGREHTLRGVARPPVQRLIPAALSALALLVAFLQRPGDAYSDTRLELAADPPVPLPGRRHVEPRPPTSGHVQSGQFVGYLFPMGPWFAGADALGVPVWVAQRIWLGLLLALAAGAWCA